MKLKIYSIRDSKAEIYRQPFFCSSHGEAERNFEMLVNDSKSLVSQYPDDFDLYYIGKFDDDKGMVEALVTPEHLVKGNLLKKVNGSMSVEQAVNEFREKHLTQKANELRQPGIDATQEMQ